MRRRRRRPVEHEYFMLRVLHAGVKQTNKLAIIALAGLFCAGVYGLTLPQVAELASLQDKLEDKRNEAVELERERERVRQQVLLLNSDPEYLEIAARDRNDLYRPGETVYRIEREPTRRAIEIE